MEIWQINPRTNKPRQWRNPSHSKALPTHPRDPAHPGLHPRGALGSKWGWQIRGSHRSSQIRRGTPLGWNKDTFEGNPRPLTSSFPSGMVSWVIYCQICNHTVILSYNPWLIAHDLIARHVLNGKLLSFLTRIWFRSTDTIRLFL